MDKETVILNALKQGKLTIKELVGVVADAFPEVSPQSLRVIVHRALNKLQQAGLVEKEGDYWKLVPQKTVEQTGVGGETCSKCGFKLDGIVHNCKENLFSLVKWDGEWLPVSYPYVPIEPSLSHKSGYYCPHCRERFTTVQRGYLDHPVAVPVVCPHCGRKFLWLMPISAVKVGW